MAMVRAPELLIVPSAGFFFLISNIINAFAKTSRQMTEYYMTNNKHTLIIIYVPLQLCWSEKGSHKSGMSQHQLLKPDKFVVILQT